jgi:SAM-dependent methyltransferase
MREHWQYVYETKEEKNVSWYQEHPSLSFQWIQNARLSLDSAIIDVGGGASRLVDYLLQVGYRRLTVLDISAAALQLARQRLGAQAAAVTWLEGDITQVELPHHTYDLWHDRAVFHFLINEAERARYVAAVRRAVRPDGHVIVATFGPDGPTQCSGLSVARYNSDRLHGEFGAGFELVNSTSELHQTPFGTQQAFIYCYCRKR